MDRLSIKAEEHLKKYGIKFIKNNYEWEDEELNARHSISEKEIASNLAESMHISSMYEENGDLWICYTPTSYPVQISTNKNRTMAIFKAIKEIYG